MNRLSRSAKLRLLILAPLLLLTLDQRFKTLTQSRSTFTIWSSDFHISLPKDVKDVFERWPEEFNVRIQDESLSGHCDLTRTCAKRLALLNSDNGLTLTGCPNKFKNDFWQYYRANKLFQDVDAFLITFSIGMSELFMSFGRPIIIIVPTRYEVGRTDKTSWQRLNMNLRAIAQNPRNTIVANNMYDAEYLMHFTGLTDIRVLPSLCGYTRTLYRPRRREVLIGPSRLSNGGSEVVRQLQFEVTHMKVNLHFAPVRDLYPTFTYADIASHMAILIIPYQISIMSIMEYYRMGIPLFVPSIKLLVKWQLKHLVLDELSWNCVHKKCTSMSSIQPHPSSKHGISDPNNILNETELFHWLQYADFYQWPCIHYFDGWIDLIQMLNAIDFERTHRCMMAFNWKQTNDIKRGWRDVIDRAMQPNQSLGSHSRTTISWETAMKEAYPTLHVDTLRMAC